MSLKQQFLNEHPIKDDSKFNEDYIKYLENIINNLPCVIYEDWSTKADKNGTIDIPDRLDKLVNKIAMQIRFHTISGKNEVQTIVDITKIADDFFNKPKN